jgi:hypothetical protein
MKDEDGNTYFKEYWDNPPPPLTNAERDEAELEGIRRREQYIKKHPREKVDPSPAGWDEPMMSESDKKKLRKKQ